MKDPLWREGQDDFGFNRLIRDFLQKCSGDKIVDMLKNILSTEEKSLLVKSEFPFEIKTEPGYEQEFAETNHLGNFPLDLSEIGNNIFPSEDIFSSVKTEFIPWAEVGRVGGSNAGG